MLDQANHLRRLVRRCTSQEVSPARLCPHLIVVASGKGGVGTTTIAVSLAAAMASRRLRTVLVDADLYGGDAAILCGLEPSYSLADLLAGRRTIREVLQPGPGGVDVVPGVWGLERLPDYPAAAGQHLLGEFEALDGHVDLLLLDGGKGPSRVVRQVWQAADLMLVLTTPETSSIVNTYALIKRLVEDIPAVPIHLLVNLAPTAEVAEDVGRRLAEACRRLLGIRLTCAGYVPADPHVAEAAAAEEPLVIAAPGCEAARYLGRLADALAASLGGRNLATQHPKGRNPNSLGKPAANVVDSRTQETVKSQKNGKKIQPCAVHNRLQLSILDRRRAVKLA
jgi:flagellar biosynthesis protein FlhG